MASRGTSYTTKEKSNKSPYNEWQKVGCGKDVGLPGPKRLRERKAAVAAVAVAVAVAS